MHTKRILKFGGSSLADAECFRVVGKIIESRIDLNPVVVVSALGASDKRIKITDMLKESAKSLFEGGSAGDRIGEIVGFHIELINELELEKDIIAADIEALNTILERVSSGEFGSLDEALDAVMGFGEIFSAGIMAAYLRKMGMEYKFADPGEFDFVTDDNFQNADILEESLHNIACKIISAAVLIVFPGFIGCYHGWKTHDTWQGRF
jgi:aspartate kinase